MKPVIDKDYYCFDSVQVRHITKAVIENRNKDTLIAAQDSLIHFQGLKLKNYESQMQKQDTLLLNNEVLIDKKDVLIGLQTRTCDLEKQQINAIQKTS